MDPATAVVTALGAGAGLGVKDTASAVVKDAYAGLKGLLAQRFRGKPAAEAALQEYEASPEAWEARLTEHVRGVGVNEQMLQLANRILEATMGASYTVTADRIQGIQQGDLNNQTITFNE